MAVSALSAAGKGEVIIIVVLIVAPIAAVAFAGAGAVYRQIGRGGFAMEHDHDAADVGPAMTRAAHRAEIRQMLVAKADRQRARGETPVDVEAELERLTAPAPVAARADPALVAEVRQLVAARNARRARRGEEPLDVEVEVARQLRDLESLGQ